MSIARSLRTVITLAVAIMVTYEAVAAHKERDIFDEFPTRFAYVNGVTIAYQDMGDADGVPLLLVMGLGMQLTYWGDPLARSLVDHGYRLVLFDNRDAGLSERFDQYGVHSLAEAMTILMQGEPFEPPYTLNDMSNDVVGLMDYLDIESAHIGGASMGGMIAQTVTYTHPDRVRSLISMMSSSGASHLPQGSLDGAQRPPFDAPREIQIQFGIDMVRADGGNNLEVFDEKYASHRVTQDFNRSHGWTGEGRQFLAAMASGDRVEQLNSIEHRALVVHGDIDPALPLPHGQHTADLIRNSQLVIVKGMGHSLEPVLVPQITTAIITHIDGWEATIRR